MKHTSASQFRMFLSCPRKWFARYVLKIKEEQTQRQKKGSLAHAELEQYYLMGKQPSEPLAVAALGCLPKYGEGWAPEFKFDLAIRDGLQIVGQIDLHNRFTAGVIDYKTLKDSRFAKEQFQLRNDVQLLTYAWAHRRLFGECPSVAICYMVEATQTAYMLGAQTDAQLLDVFDAQLHKVAVQQAQLHETKPLPGNVACPSNAPFAAACQSFGGCYFREQCAELQKGNPMEFFNPTPLAAKATESKIYVELQDLLQRLNTEQFESVCRGCELVNPSIADVAKVIIAAGWAEKSIETFKAWLAPINPPDAAPNKSIDKADDPVTEVDGIGKKLAELLGSLTGCEKGKTPTVGECIDYISLDPETVIKTVSGLSANKYQAMLTYVGKAEQQPVPPSNPTTLPTTTNPPQPTQPAVQPTPAPAVVPTKQWEPDLQKQIDKTSINQGLDKFAEQAAKPIPVLIPKATEVAPPIEAPSIFDSAWAFTLEQSKVLTGIKPEVVIALYQINLGAMLRGAK